MKPKVDLQFSGLATSVNPFSAAPELSCAILDNCLLRNKNLIEPFRGYTKTANNPDGTLARIFPWLSNILSFSSANTLRAYAASAWSSAYTQPASNNWASQTTFAAPDANNQVRAIQAAKSFFFTTSKGVKVVDALGNSVQDAGIPAPYMQGPDAGVPTVVGGTSNLPNWLQNGWSAAYRIVLGKYDANKNLILSAPSNPVVVTNGLGQACYVVLGCGLPVNANGATFVQLYRTVQSNNPAGPGDEMFLVQETLLTTLSPSSAGIFTINDNFSDNNGVGSTLLGVPLYTNPVTGNGIGSANALPPLGKDLAEYNGSLLLANTTERHSIELQLIGVGALVSGTSTIVIGGVTYKADNSTNATTSPPKFELFTGGGVSQNIESTALALVNVVNQYNFSHGGGIQASYLSTQDTMPGQMLFEEVGIGGSAFTIHVGQDAQNCWNPDLSLASIVLTSDNNNQPSRLWWSATNEPWSVPSDNWVDIGSPEQAIVKIIVVRSTVFVFKKDGVWTLTGNAPPFAVTPFDAGLVLLARETAVVVNNQIYCLTNRGYVYVTESGVSPSLSYPIERDLNYLEFNNTSYPGIAFGVPSETDGLAFLAFPQNGDSNCSQQYAFNAFNPSWSRLQVPDAAHGCFDPATQGLCWAVDSGLYQERKLFTGVDHQWPSIASTVSASTSSVTAVVAGGLGIVVSPGDLLTQGGSTFLVLAVTGSGPYTCTIDAAHSFTAAAVTISRAISCHIRFLPWSGGDPTILKRFDAVLLAIRNASFEGLTLGFNSESTNTFTSVALPGPDATGTAGADTEVPQFIFRAGIPQSVGSCAILGLDIVIQQAAAFWQLEAVRFTFDEDSLEEVR